MSESNENFCTPLQTRRLGLRRNNSSIIAKESKNTTPLASNKRATTTATTPRLQPQSDVRVNYRNLETAKRNNDAGAGTPSTSLSSLQQRQSVSTNCRPYRLSLSKRIREKMTKKRLEFHVANEMEKEEEEQKKSNEQERREQVEKKANDRIQEKCQDSDNDCSGLKHVTGDTDDETNDTSHEDNSISCSDLKPEEMSRDQLLAHIEELRKDLKARQEHARKVLDLKQAIETWKLGFSSALRDLRDKITPHCDNETMLEHLRIPQEMLKYVND